MPFLRLILLLLLAAVLPAPAQEPLDQQRGEALFAQIDEMLASMAEITGLKIKEPIPRALLTQDEIRELVESRLGEETNPEEIRQEELFLKTFGYVDPGFDLEKELVEILTEQATALYDYKSRKLYLATWTPEDMQEFALVHELAHALADQHFNLRKFTKAAKNSEQDVARSAVMEGQASWIMTEYVMRQGNRSLLDSRLLAIAASAASRIEAADYPVFANTPLYMQESLLFPYTKGLMFQQTVLEKFGKAGFSRVFLNPPASTQHIIDPETYLSGRQPSNPKLPKFEKPKHYQRTFDGQLGQLDLWILVKQFLDIDTADEITAPWRGGQFEIWEDQAHRNPMLRFVVEWSDEQAAAGFFAAYKKIRQARWKNIDETTAAANEWSGQTPAGRFRLTQTGAIVASVEGIPDAKLKKTLETAAKTKDGE